MESKELEALLNVFHDKCLIKHGMEAPGIGSGFPGCQKEVDHAIAAMQKLFTAEVERAVQKFAADIQRKVDLEYRAGGRYPGHLIEPWADIVRPIINKAAVPQKDKI